MRNRNAAILQRLLLLGACLVAGTLRADTPPSPIDMDWGFLAARYQMVGGATRTRVLGPFFEHTAMPDGTVVHGIRPFFVRVNVPSMRITRRYALWPTAYLNRYMNELKWRILLAYGRKGRVGDPDCPRMRFNIFPFYFQHRDAEGRTSVAVFPLGGTLHNFILYDRIRFLAFPLWMQWQAGQVESQNVLWPLIASTRSRDDDRIRRMRILPFYARSSYKGKYEKHAILWPFWTHSRFLSEGSKGHAFILWPLLGRIARENESGWLFLPPLFRFSSGDDGRVIHAPWPLIQIRNTRHMQKVYCWPLFGRRQVGAQTRHFFLWPFIWRRQLDLPETYSHGITVAPFLITDRLHEKTEAGEPGEIIQRSTRVWPLFNYQRHGNIRRTRALEFWPFRDSLPLEQTWAPFWTLFSHTVIEDKGYDSELFWGLYRQQVIYEKRRYNALFPLYSYERDNRIDEDFRKWTFLKGLFGYKREAGARRYRLLYFFEFGGQKNSP